MSFIYPRTISVSRANEAQPTQVGDIGYSAERGPSQEAVIATDLPCSIQLDRIGQRNVVGLPDDAPSRPTWVCYIPARAAALGLIRPDDIITDDLGVRYNTAAPYWDSLGYAVRMTVLEV